VHEVFSQDRDGFDSLEAEDAEAAELWPQVRRLRPNEHLGSML
jgi:hypothetical protein